MEILFYEQMARQAGTIKITGTISGICFYTLQGGYYARKKSSLSRRRVKTSTAFGNTMRYASLLAKASVAGSEVYRGVPKENRSRKLYQKLTGMAMRMLKEGLNKLEIVDRLKSIV